MLYFILFFTYLIFILLVTAGYQYILCYSHCATFCSQYIFQQRHFVITIYITHIKILHIVAPRCHFQRVTITKIHDSTWQYMFFHSFKLIRTYVGRMAHTPLLQQIPEDDTRVSKHVGVYVRVILVYIVSWSASVGKYIEHQYICLTSNLFVLLGWLKYCVTEAYRWKIFKMFYADKFSLGGFYRKDRHNSWGEMSTYYLCGSRIVSNWNYVHYALHTVYRPICPKVVRTCSSHILH